MLRNPLENPIVTVSVRVYQVLLSAYPAKFRKEYGSHMSQVFRDCCLRAFRQSGTKGMLKLWAITLLDLLRSLIEEHLQKETFMTISKFIRLSGWSLMLGSVTFSIFMIDAFVESNFYDPYMRLKIFYDTRVVFGILVSSILLAVGFLGLRIRYGKKVGIAGKHILLTGAITGPLISLLGVIGSEARAVNWAWLLLYTSHIILLACLTVFGILTLRTKPLPRWNSLPLMAGFWFPVLLPLAMLANANGVSGNLILDIVKTTILLQSIALFLLGYILQTNMPENPLAPI